MKSRVPPLGWEVCGTFRLLTRNKFDWGYVLFLDWYLLRVGNFKPPQKGSWLLSKLLTSTFVLFLWESPCPPPSFPSPPYKALWCTRFIWIRPLPRLCIHEYFGHNYFSLCAIFFIFVCIKEQGWLRRDKQTWITDDELDKFRQSFSRCANHKVNAVNNSPFSSLFNVLRERKQLPYNDNSMITMVFVHKKWLFICY